jgi:hypothetical protein
MYNFPCCTNNAKFMSFVLPMDLFFFFFFFCFFHTRMTCKRPLRKSEIDCDFSNFLFLFFQAE